MLPRKQLLAFSTSGLFVATATLIYAFLPNHLPSSLDFFVPSEAEGDHSDSADWSKFAYIQYATTVPYLCNSVMLFERIHSLGTKADRLLLYAQTFTPDEESITGTLLRKARDEYGAVLKPIEVQKRASDDRKWYPDWTP